MRNNSSPNPPLISLETRSILRGGSHANFELMRSNRYKKASSRITRRNKVRSFLGLFLKIGLSVAILVGLVFLLRADFLRIKDFKILGAETIQAENIKNVASNFISGNKLFVIPKSDIFLLNKEKMATALLAAFPGVEKVEINKQFFSKQIELKITERKSDFLWCSLQEECFSMTKNGLVFEKSENTGDKIIFRGVLDNNPLMKNFATEVEMQNYLKLIDVLKNADIKTSAVNIESSDKGVNKTNIGDVIFNPEETDLSSAAQNGVLLINNIKSKNPSAHFQYIDIRFGNKIFYKLY